MIFKDAYFSLKIISFYLVTNFQNQGTIYSSKKDNNMMVIQCTDFLCHGSLLLCHRQDVQAQFRQSVPCMFPFPNLLDRTEEEVTKLPWNPSTCDLHCTIWNILNIMGFPQLTSWLFWLCMKIQIWVLINICSLIKPFMILRNLNCRLSGFSDDRQMP